MGWSRAGLGGGLIVCAIAAGGCTAIPPSGIFKCTQHSDCPPGFVCQASDQLCYSEAQLAGTQLENDAGPAGPLADSGGPPEPPLDAGITPDSGIELPDSSTVKEPVVLPVEPVFMPHTALQLPKSHSLAAGAVHCSSPHYSAVRSIGQSPASGYPVRRSASYLLVGGVIGVSHALR